MPTTSLLTPTTIFTGFLGSGKTTIITHLITQLQANGQQVVYIKNELGDTDVDAQLLRGQQVVAKELLNGCICCTLVGPFITAINEVITSYHPDRIIIEASGAADPAAIALMVSSHPQLKRDGVVCVIDVTTFEGYKDLSVTARNQAHFTDLLLLNKVELADDQRKRAVVGYIRELNTSSPIVEAPLGHCNPELIFGLSTPIELERELQNQATEEKEHPHHDHHLSDDQLDSTSYTTTAPCDLAMLQKQLATLPKNVFRVKGFVLDAGHQAWLVNKVGTRIEVEPWPLATPPSQTTLVFLGFAVSTAADTVKENVAAAFS